MNKEHFERHLYYSQTEVVKLYHISLKKYRKLIADLNIPVAKNPEDMGTYQFARLYVLKTDVEELGLEKRVSKRRNLPNHDNLAVYLIASLEILFILKKAWL